MNKGVMDREAIVLGSIGVTHPNQETAVRQISRYANDFGLPINCMLEWNATSGHLPVPAGEDRMQDAFVQAWHEKQTGLLIASAGDTIPFETFDYATDVHTNMSMPGVVFFTYPVGVNKVPTKLQATPLTLNHPISPAAYTPDGNIVGITDQTAAAIREALRASI